MAWLCSVRPLHARLHGYSHTQSQRTEETFRSRRMRYFAAEGEQRMAREVPALFEDAQRRWPLKPGVLMSR